MKPRIFESSKKNVWKYVFKIPKAITESVLYKYKSFEDRTVICCSVQSGCPFGCTFCGTGKKFLRNLDTNEIIAQVDYIFKDKKINTSKVTKLQIMFMSMGEPFLNYDNVKEAIKILNKKYPNAQLLVSTMAPKSKDALKKFIDLSKKIDKIGLQFSIHQSTNKKRDKLIPFKNKLSLEEIRDYGIEWWKETGRKPYCNYCIDGENNTQKNFKELRKLFSSNVFCFTFSVICSKDETMKDVTFRNLKIIDDFRKKFQEKGYDTRTFDPAGQDDIGGGCGQLWYVQNFLKNNFKYLNVII